MAPERPLSENQCLDGEWDQLSSFQPQINSYMDQRIPFVVGARGARVEMGGRLKVGRNA